MNKCAKFLNPVQAVKKLNSISRERLNFLRRPFLCTTLYRNLKQASNFGGIFDQLFLWIFLWNFHRRCLSASSIPWCKKVKKLPETQIKGGVLPYNQELLEIEKRLCVRLRSAIKTTRENLQIAKHKSVWWAKRTPSRFVLCDLQIFSGGIYSPSAASRTISLSISKCFCY